MTTFRHIYYTAICTTALKQVVIGQLYCSSREVFNCSSDYKSSPIYISCDGGKKTKLYPEHEVAQFEIQKDCEASNEHLRIEKVLTAKLDTKVWKDKSISIISFPIEDIGPEKFNLKNPASKEVVKKRREEK